AETLYRKIHERKMSATADEQSMARRGLALALVKQAQPAKITEALSLVNLALDDKGLVADIKIAEAQEERLSQAKVLGSLAHYRARGKAIALLEGLQASNALSVDDQFLLARLLSLQR